MKLLEIIGIATIGGLVGWMIGASTATDHAYSAGVQEGRSYSFNEAREDVEDEMRRNCKAWFNDRRGRNVPGLIIACTAPDWMIKP
jgi:hypothetical protein